MNEALALIETKAQEEADKDKKDMYLKMLAKVRQTMLARTLENMTVDGMSKNGTSEEDFRVELLESASEMLMTWLDKQFGKTVTDNSIFSSLPRHFESQFHKDMAALNVNRKKKLN